MDLGKPDVDNPGHVQYSSEVISDTQEVRDRFMERVKQWTKYTGIQLGEGTIKSFSHLNGGEARTLYLYAPLVKGDAADAYYTIFPDDPTCINNL